MARIENADGIYPRKVVALADKMPPEDITLLEEWFRPETLDSRLGNIKAAVAPLLGGLSDQAGTERQEAARELYMRIDKLLTMLSDCDSREAARQGIGIGILAEKIHAMGFEPKVVHANRVTKGLGRGREKKAEAASERRKEIAAAVKARMLANRRDSITFARGIVAEQMGISFNTVRAATTGMKKPSRKKK